MVIALLTGGLSLPQAILALLPEAPVDGGGERPALRLPRGDERLPRGLRRPRRDRRLRRRRGGRPPRPQRPAAPVAPHHEELRARRERAHRHRGPRPRRAAEALRPRRHGGGEPEERRRAAHRRGAPAGLDAALPGPAAARGGRARRPPPAPAPTTDLRRPAARLRHDPRGRGGAALRPRRDGQGGGGLDGGRHAARRHARPAAAAARGPLQAALRPGDEPAHRPDPRLVGLRDAGGARRPLRAVDERQDDRPRLRPARADPLHRGRWPALAEREGVATLDLLFEATRGRRRARDGPRRGGLPRGRTWPAAPP